MSSRSIHLSIYLLWGEFEPEVGRLDQLGTLFALRWLRAFWALQCIAMQPKATKSNQKQREAFVCPHRIGPLEIVTIEIFTLS